MPTIPGAGKRAGLIVTTIPGANKSAVLIVTIPRATRGLASLDNPCIIPGRGGEVMRGPAEPLAQPAVSSASHQPAPCFDLATPPLAPAEQSCPW
jgi:hypothetical protein